MQIENGEVTLNVELAGDESAPPLLLLHGITASLRSWEWFVPALSDRFHVLSLDFRGHGKSGRATDYQPRGYVTDAVAVLEQLASQPAIVIGHSLGGVTAAALSQQRPELVRAMVLEDPPLGSTETGADLEGHAISEGFRLMKQAVPGVQASGMQADAVAAMMSILPSSSGVAMGELVSPESLLGMAAGLLELDVGVLDPILDGSVRTAFNPFQPIPVKTLLLTADPSMPDAVCIAADGDRVLATSPSVSRHVVSGAGHLIHDETKSRAEFVSQTEAFLAGL